MSSSPPPLKLLVVRHGESTNNVIASSIFAGLAAGTTTSAAAEEAWLKERVDDPPLTPKGEEEAIRLAAWLGREQQRWGNDVRLRLYSSPFLRTCQTIQPLAALGTESAVRDVGGNVRDTAKTVTVTVRDDLYEVGGVYAAAVAVAGSTSGAARTCGTGLSVDELERRFPGYDTAHVAHKTGSWYQGDWETDRAGRARAKRVAAWLRSDALRAEVGNDVMVLVAHGHFIGYLYTALLGITSDDACDAPGANRPASQAVVIESDNTSIGMFSIGKQVGVEGAPGAKKGKVMVHRMNSTVHLTADAVLSASPSKRSMFRSWFGKAALAKL
jgi:broad specificity phosphatase PhoE